MIRTYYSCIARSFLRADSFKNSFTVATAEAMLRQLMQIPTIRFRIKIELAGLKALKRFKMAANNVNATTKIMYCDETFKQAILDSISE